MPVTAPRGCAPAPRSTASTRQRSVVCQGAGGGHAAAKAARTAGTLLVQRAAIRRARLDPHGMRGADGEVTPARQALHPDPTVAPLPHEGMPQTHDTPPAGAASTHTLGTAAAQVRRVVTDLIAQGQWETGDDDILVVFDAGYDAPRMAYLLDGLPVEVLGRMRADRVMRRPAPSLKEYALSYPQGGRPPKHGKEFRFARPGT